MQKSLILSFLAAALVLQPDVAQAYIGPGLGAGVIAAVLGVVAAVAMAFVALIWYPFKRLLKKRNRPVAEDAS